VITINRDGVNPAAIATNDFRNEFRDTLDELDLRSPVRLRDLAIDIDRIAMSSELPGSIRKLESVTDVYALPTNILKGEHHIVWPLKTAGAIFWG
jgi:hypothetical protein